MLTLLLALAAAEGDAGRALLVQGTTGVRSASLELHAGGVVAREGEAGVAFGTLRVGRGKTQPTYLVLFKHRHSAETPLVSSEEVFAEGDAASAKQTLTIDGRSLVIELQVTVDAKGGARKTLTLNKKPVELSKGRVLLVDLTATPPRWEQRKADLPEVGETMSKKAAEGLAGRLVEAASKDAKAKEFAEAAGR